ncbi:MAG: protecting protein DprA protein [candidate division TM6 bacterium GW2011_GWF2_43_17]|nr:MAG: protecting protein DprA protein [candidate division TM6 bacterium GW2011_GWF2_43_17]
MLVDASRLFLLHANMVSGVGPIFFQRLNQAVFGDFAACYRWKAQDFVANAGCSQELADRLVAALLDVRARDVELATVAKLGASWVTVFDDHYPARLRAIYAPPTILMYLGSFAAVCAEYSVAFVGARKASGYAREVAQTLVRPLVGSGVTIVSGGALGADTYAHQAALDVGGKTVAVVGAGLLYPYPRNNVTLFDRIVSSGGAVVSPFPVSMRAVPGNFPARNRVIAGLASMTIVLQAAKKSGALITAYFALEQGREVGAVPGSILDELSMGCHQLLSQGATPVSSVGDIFQACGWEKAVVAPTVCAHTQQSIQKDAVDPLVAACDMPQSLDDLTARFSDLDPVILQDRLLDLCMQGLLQQDFTGQFRAGV